jgi:hypothetical protein
LPGKPASIGHPPTSSDTRIPISRFRAESGLRDGPTLRFSVMGFLEKSSLPAEIRFDDLRHTAGSLALRQGMPLHAVSKMLGHSDPAMTLRRYAHVLEDMEDEGGAGRWTASSRARVPRDLPPGFKEQLNSGSTSCSTTGRRLSGGPTLGSDGGRFMHQVLNSHQRLETTHTLRAKVPRLAERGIFRCATSDGVGRGLSWIHRRFIARWFIGSRMPGTRNERLGVRFRETPFW